VLGALPAAQSTGGNGNRLVGLAAAATLTARATAAAATATPEPAALASRTIRASFRATFGVRDVRCRACLGRRAFRTGRPVGPRWAIRTRRTFRARRTLRTCGNFSPRLAFDARRALGPRGTLGPRRALRTCRTLGARRAIGSGRAFRARRTFRAWRTVALRRPFDHSLALRALDRRSGQLAGQRCAAAAAASSAAPCGLLFQVFTRGCLRRTLWLLLRRTLPRLLLSLRTLLAVLRQAFPVAATLLLALLFASSAAAALLLAVAAALVFRARHLAGALLELPNLFLHVAARLRVLLRAQFVVTAVGAALPSFRISAFASCTENGFRQRHRKRRALYTSGCG
jgi:hypothetical protein